MTKVHGCAGGGEIPPGERIDRLGRSAGAILICYWI